MVKYVLKRIGLAFITATIIISATFITVKLLPFSVPAFKDNQMFAFFEKQVNLGYIEDLKVPDPERGKPLWTYTTGQGSTRLTHNYYEVPILEQYFNWIKNIVTKWDWGTSTEISPNLSAIKIIGQKLPYTIKVNIWAVFISVPLGILLGIWAALKKNSMTDHIISTGVMIFISIPSFVIITFLMLIFCYKLQWLPTKWPSSSSPLNIRALGYILPVACLSFGSIAGYCRFTRAELCEVMSSDYLLLARTKGLTKKQSILRHALRNAMVPIVPAILAEFIGVLGGSMILENLYGIPGIGRLYINSISLKDYNVLLVDMAVFTTIGLLSGVLLDISYGFIDPRIRMGAKK